MIEASSRVVIFNIVREKVNFFKKNNIILSNHKTHRVVVINPDPLSNSRLLYYYYYFSNHLIPLSNQLLPTQSSLSLGLT